MKNILIATDFSENSTKAAKFALELAHKLEHKSNTKIHFLHVYSLPIVNSEMPELIDYSFFDEIKTKQLNHFVEKLNTINLTVVKKCLAGSSFISELEDYCNKEKIDLLTIGLTGSSLIDEILMGSNTLHLLTHSKIPVLAVPKNYVLKDTFKIGFAFDGNTIKNKNSLTFLTTFSKLFGDKFYAFHVSKTDNYNRITKELESYFDSNDFNLKIELNENVDNGIVEHITNEKIEMLAVVPRKHSFFNRLFHLNHTKEFAKLGLIPVLTIPE